MWVRTTQLLFIAMMGSAIAVFAAQSAPSKSSPGTDEDRMLLGTWKLNVGKSKYRIGTPPKSQTRVYEPHEQGVKATITTVYADGRSTTVEYTANYDALEYPVTGTQDVDTIALKKVSSHCAGSERRCCTRTSASVSNSASLKGRPASSMDTRGRARFPVVMARKDHRAAAGAGLALPTNAVDRRCC